MTMKDLGPLTPEDGVYALRAMMTVSRADGLLHDKERRMIELVAELLELEVDLDSLERIDGAELAKHLPGPKAREAFIQRLIVLTTLDGEVTADEVTAVEDFAAALGVEERAVKNIRQLADGHVRMVAFDLGRRSFAPKLVGTAWRARGVLGLWQIAKTAAGLRDEAVAARFAALGELPQGTLGRALHGQFVDNGFPHPGQPHGPPDMLLFHDLGHVLGGYGTTADQELLVAGFQAGYMDQDGLAMYLMVAMLFQLAVEPIAKARGVAPARGMLDIDRYMEAVARGRAMNVNLLDWEPWPHMPRPLEELRAELGIP
jgi:uncharacterized tellurite resistance protein B-like protein